MGFIGRLELAATSGGTELELGLRGGKLPFPCSWGGYAGRIGRSVAVAMTDGKLTNAIKVSLK